MHYPFPTANPIEVKAAPIVVLYYMFTNEQDDVAVDLGNSFITWLSGYSKMITSALFTELVPGVAGSKPPKPAGSSM
jgi:hypothetical protein